MYMVEWQGERVTVDAEVEVTAQFTGARLRDAYATFLRAFTVGLVRFRGNSLRLGPLELLRFGKPTVNRTAVVWPIEGGLLAGAPGGEWRIRYRAGTVEASVSRYRPRLPRPLYVISHLQVHLTFTRLFLLGLRGRDPSPAPLAMSPDRVRAATVDAAFCGILTRLSGRRSLGRFVAIAAAYHVACWSTTGQTLGGMVTRQRVVSVDGARLVLGQALLRFALLPVSWIIWRPVHDEIAATTVIVK